MTQQPLFCHSYRSYGSREFLVIPVFLVWTDSDSNFKFREQINLSLWPGWTRVKYKEKEKLSKLINIDNATTNLHETVRLIKVPVLEWRYERQC